MKKIQNNSPVGNVKQNILNELKELFSLLDGEHFYLLDTECKIQGDELHIMPLDENDLKYNVRELDEVGLALLFQNIMQICLDKGIL